MSYHRGPNHFEKYGIIWSKDPRKRGSLIPCVNCHKPRWVSLYQYEIGIGIRNAPLNAHCKKGDYTGLCQECRNDKYGYQLSSGFYMSQGYRHIKILKDDPYYAMSSKRGYIQEHRYVMAQHLGRNLNSNEIVHHRDGNRLNNDISNLELTRRGQQHETSYTDGVAYGMLLMLMMLSVPLSRRGDGDI